jgi:cardiolipin synthase
VNIEIAVDSEAFCVRLGQDLASARERAWVQTLSFEGDRAGAWLSDALLASPARDRRVIVDCYTNIVQSDRFIWHPRNLADPVLRAEVRSTRRMMRTLRGRGVDVHFTAPLGLLLRRMPARDHKKIMLIDDDVAWIGGMNFSDHNFAWHDMMLRIEHADIARFLADDFTATWAGGGQAGRIRFDGCDLLSLDGVTNEAMLVDVIERIRTARRSVVVHNAYVTFPFCDALREAAGNGARVTVITPAANNRGFLREYMAWEAARSGFEMRLYPDRMSHLKAMLIDDECLIAGSSNFDWLTHRFQAELIATITDADAVEQFRTRVLEPDLAISEPSTHTAHNALGQRADSVMRHIERLALRLCPRSPRPRPGPGSVHGYAATPALRTD